MSMREPISRLSASTIPLIADGDTAQRKVELEVVREMGYNPMETGMGGHAWRVIKRKKIGLIVASWELPEISGLSILKLVRKDEELYETPFVLIAGNVTRPMVMDAAEAGVNAIALVPLKIEVLRQKVIEAMTPDDDPDRQKADAAFEDGLAAMAQGNFEEAAQAFEKILDVYKAAEVYYNLGYIHSAKGEFPEALKNFRKAIHINHTFARAYKQMAQCYNQMGDTKKAQNALNQAAEIYMNREMDDQAEETLNDVLKLNPDTINVYNSLGILYRRKGDFNKAKKQYRRALKVNPKDENIRYNLARTCYDEEQYDEAMEVLDEALAMNPDFAEAMHMKKAIQMIKKKGLR